MRNTRHGFVTPFVLVLAAAAWCVAPRVNPTMRPADAPLASLCELPAGVADRDVYFGPWGKSGAPDPGAEYTFIRPKQWQDAFRAGGDAPDVADQFMRALRARIARAQQIGGNN